jgi:anti-sigma regulatory factor (Ser/Thr protein kinase)
VRSRNSEEAGVIHNEKLSELTYVFDRSKHAPAGARGQVELFLASTAQCYDPEAVLLIVDELVANVTRHGGAPGELRIWESRRAFLRIEVFDHANDVLPKMRTTSQEPASGRGLQIVDALSQSWGVDVSVDGKTVWADLWAIGHVLLPSPPN